MPRPFAYNPSQTTITGTTQKTNLAIGVDTLDYSSRPGSVTWWMGPDETDAYIICIPVPAGNHPTPVGNVGTVKFWKTTDYTDLGFLNLINVMGGQSFASAADAYDWLDTNGYWTNYVISGASVFAAGSFTQIAEPQIPTGTRLTLLGAADYDFAIGSGIGGTINSIYELADGRIAYAGSGVSINGTTNGLVIVATDGTVDTAFNTNLGTAPVGAINVICQQADGKIVVGGTFTAIGGVSVNRLARINLDGTVDTTFCTNLGTGFNSTVWDVAIYPSTNKLSVCGAFTTFGGTTMYYVARVNTDGTRDTAFNSPSNGFNAGPVFNVLPQADNKVYCAGAFSLYNNTGTNARGCIRLNASGGQDGWPTGNGFLSMPSAHARAIDIGTSIVYYSGNSVTSYQGTNYGNAGCIALKKADATVDTTFSTNTSASISGAQLNKLVLNKAGTKILVAGGYVTSNKILNLDGTQDTTFNVGTGYSASINGTVGCLAASGVYLPYGGVFKRTAVSGFGKVKDTGYIDSSFTKAFNSGTGVLGFTPAKDGKIFAYGTFTTYDGASRVGVAKFSANGTRDASFPDLAVSNWAGGVIEANNLMEYPDGRFLVFGRYSNIAGVNKCAIARFSAAGVQDTNFRNDNPGNNTAYSFCTGVVGSLNYVGLQGGLLLADQKILAYGTFPSYNLQGQNTSQNTYRYIMRFNANGSVDSTWTWPQILNNRIDRAVEQSDGKVVAIGTFTTYGTDTVNRIIRYNLDGSRDTTFASGTGFNNTINVIIRNPADDSLYIGGNFTSYNGTTANRLVKLTKDGAIDTSFAGYTVGMNQAVNDLKLADDGGVWVAMSLLNSTWNGSAACRSGIMKLFPDGTVDTSFDISAVSSSAGPTRIYVRYPTV